MKKVFRIVLCVLGVILILVGGYYGYSTITDHLNSNAEFFIDSSTLGKKLWNPVSNVNVWAMNDEWLDAEKNADYDIFEFVDYVQFMQMSGGSASRDLFLDPGDSSVLDDYDFTRLIECCRSVVDLGAKPHLKFGSVPEKFSSRAMASPEFGTNMLPPDDYDAYYAYISAIAQALVDEFGVEEVQSWHFGVMTEFNNANWFRAEDKGADSSAEAYMKLYDYTEAALESVLGEEIYIGAHALAQSDGLWDVEQFIRHCAEGENYCTGETGTRLCYLAGSHYDVRPGLFAPLSRNLPDTISYLRERAERYGLELVYGIDEGRLLMGNHRGSRSNNLVSRVVGDTYQAAYDARTFRQMFENDINYFSAWSYLSGGLLEGNPSVSYHVARFAAGFDGAQLVAINKTNGIGPAEIEAVAAYNEESGTLLIMAYNFKNSTGYSGNADLSLHLQLPQLEGKTVTVTQYVIDDDANYFDEWRADRGAYQIGDSAFGWSPDDPNISSALKDTDAKVLYDEELFARYTEASKLVPSEEQYTLDGASLTLRITLPPQAVVFWIISE